MDFIIQHAGTIGLLFFFGVFSAIVLWAYWPTNKQAIESHKYIPLSEEN